MKTTKGTTIDPALRKIIWVLVLGALAPALDSTIVNVAIPSIGTALHTSLATTQWTITIYLLAMGMAMPATGWLTERFGGKRMWLISLGVFLAGSILSGIAWDATSLIAFRAVQGIGAGLIMPVVTTLLVRIAGSGHLGGMMAIAMLPVAVVPIFGPVVGGLIINYWDWRWVFYINLPLCLAAMYLAWKKMEPDTIAATSQPLDILGLALLSPGLATLIYALSQVSKHSGFSNTAVLVPGIVGLVLIAAFIWHVHYKANKHPLINLNSFRIPSYSASVAVLFLSGLSVYGPLLLLVLYYQNLVGLSALMTGLALAPQGLGSLLPRGFAGGLTDRLGARPVVLIGLLLTALGTVPFAFAGPDSNQWLLAAAQFVRGLGLAPVTIAVMAGAFKDVPSADIPDASSTTRIVQQVGGSFGVAVLSAILITGLITHGATGQSLAYHAAFWWSIGFTVLAAIPAFFLPHDQASSQGQAAPATI